MLRSLALSAVVVGLSLVGTMARAQTEIGRLQKANATLQAQIQRAETADAPLPRLSDPKARPLFEAAYDQTVLNGLDRNDLNQVMETCFAPGPIVFGYNLHGVAHLSNSDASAKNQIAIAALLTQNTVTYQDETTPGMTFMLSCFAIAMPKLNHFWQGLPADQKTAQRREGMVKVRRDISQMYTGAVGMQLQLAFSAANRAAVLDTAARHADAFASALSLEDRKSLVGIVDAADKSASAAARVKLMLIRRAMSSTVCEGLCAA